MSNRESLHILQQQVHTEADGLMKQRVPKQRDGLKLRITYQNDERDTYATIVLLPALIPFGIGFFILLIRFMSKAWGKK